MKRITIMTVVFFLLAALQVMGQTTATTTTTTNPPPKPAPKHTAKPTSAEAPKGQASEGNLHPVNNAAENGGRTQESEEARQRSEATTTEGAAGGQGSEGGLRCRGPEREPCSEEMVRHLARRLAEKSAEHPLLAEINTLILESPDGRLSCSQNDGRPCTTEQIRALDEHVAREERCEIRYEPARSNTGYHSSTATKP